MWDSRSAGRKFKPGISNQIEILADQTSQNIAVVFAPSLERPDRIRGTVVPAPAWPSCHWLKRPTADNSELSLRYLGLIPDKLMPMRLAPVADK